MIVGSEVSPLPVPKDHTTAVNSPALHPTPAHPPAPTPDHTSPAHSPTPNHSPAHSPAHFSTPTPAPTPAPTLSPFFYLVGKGTSLTGVIRFISLPSLSSSFPSRRRSESLTKREKDLHE